MTKIKTYRSGTRMATTVVIGRRRVHVSFRPTTEGGSVLTTDDAALQAALEASPLYGRWFRLIGELEVPKAEAKEEAPTALTEVSVNSESEAKEYLAEHYGVPRQSLRSRSQIATAARKAGIEFVGITL